MIDITLFRENKTYKEIIQSEKRRFRTEKLPHIVKKLDRQVIEKQFLIDQFRKEINKIQTEIKNFYKKKADVNIDLLKEQQNKLKNEIKVNEIEFNELIEERNKELRKIGNIIFNDVIISETEDDNGVVGIYESDRKISGYLHHSILMNKINGLDMERGSKVSGHRGFFLMNDLALLQKALAQYAVDFLVENKYSYVQTPFLMRKDIMEDCCQLSDFDEQLYKVGESHYLIATSEQPISSFYKNERLEKCDLPKKFAGDSFCFRKEAGAHGKDNRGIFRIHQFQKIEQFIISSPDNSSKHFTDMVKISEDFLQSLQINYRVVSIVSKELNDAAAIKYDIEAYFPNENRYRELVSVSNCTDYQSRDLNVRYGSGKMNNKKEYVHMLNGTLCAVHRTLCCLVENYQTDEGIEIPTVLQKYMGGKKLIKFLK